MKNLLLPIIFLLTYSDVFSQDSHYWSGLFNPVGLLTPGAAIADTRDSGVLYFNPALLANNTKNTATLNGSLYKLNNIRFKNGAGEVYPLNSLNIDITPLMGSGVINLRGKRNLNLGYAIMYNPVIDFNATQQRDGMIDALDNSYSPGDEQFVGQINLQNRMNTVTGLLSGGFKLNNKWSAGLTMEAQYLTQKYQDDTNVRVIINEASTTSVLPLTAIRSTYDVSRYNIGLRFRAGIAYDDSPNHFGLTFTTPMMKLIGSGRVLSDNMISNLTIPESSPLAFNLLATTRQTGLKQQWKIPFSVGFGYARELPWGKIHLASEYFHRIRKYSILQPSPDNFFRLEEGIIPPFNPAIVALQDARRALFNFGLGLIYRINKDVDLLSSIRTDKSAGNKDLHSALDGHSYNITNFSITHFELGTNYKRRKFNLRSGLLLSYGRTAASQKFIDFDTPNENNILTGEDSFTPATYLSVGIMFAYMHNF